MRFNYSKLKGKIKEVYDTQGAFASALGLSRAALSQKLNNTAQFNQTEIANSMELLHIDRAYVNDYFFTIEV